MGYFENVHEKRNREIKIKHDFKFFELLLKYVLFMEETVKK